jgi:hypothetical protein
VIDPTATAVSCNKGPVAEENSKLPASLRDHAVHESGPVALARKDWPLRDRSAD